MARVEQPLLGCHVGSKEAPFLGSSSGTWGAHLLPRVRGTGGVALGHGVATDAGWARKGGRGELGL
jgi:hypothetical protein